MLRSVKYALQKRCEAKAHRKDEAFTTRGFQNWKEPTETFKYTKIRIVLKIAPAWQIFPKQTCVDESLDEALVNEKLKNI